MAAKAVSTSTNVLEAAEMMTRETKETETKRQSKPARVERKETSRRYHMKPVKGGLILQRLSAKEEPEALSIEEIVGTDKPPFKNLKLLTLLGMPVVESSREFYADFTHNQERYSWKRPLFLPAPAESYFLCEWYNIENPAAPLVLPHSRVPPQAVGVITPHQAVLWWACIMHATSQALLSVIVKRILNRQAVQRHLARLTTGALTDPVEVTAAFVAEAERVKVQSGELKLCVITKDPECMQFKRVVTLDKEKKAKEYAEHEIAAALEEMTIDNKPQAEAGVAGGKVKVV